MIKSINSHSAGQRYIKQSTLIELYVASSVQRGYPFALCRARTSFTMPTLRKWKHLSGVLSGQKGFLFAMFLIRAFSLKHFKDLRLLLLEPACDRQVTTASRDEACPRLLRLFTFHRLRQAWTHIWVESGLHKVNPFKMVWCSIVDKLLIWIWPHVSSSVTTVSKGGMFRRGWGLQHLQVNQAYGPQRSFATSIRTAYSTSIRMLMRQNSLQPTAIPLAALECCSRPTRLTATIFRLAQIFR